MPIRKLNQAQPTIIAALNVSNDLDFVDGNARADVLLLQYAAASPINAVTLTLELPPGWTVQDPSQNGHTWTKVIGIPQNKWQLSSAVPANGRKVIAYFYVDGNPKTSGAPVIIIERPPS